MAKLDFVFAADCWITPTIQCCADVVLPLATFAERQSAVGIHYGASPNMTGAVVDAVKTGETKGDLEIQYELGCRLNPKPYERFKDFEDWRDEFRLGHNFTYEHLREEVVIQREVRYKKYETGRLRPDGKVGFNTPTGRVELYSTLFKQFGDDPLPYYFEPTYSPVSTPELMEEYPFVLTTGARTYAFFHSEGKQIPLLRELNPEEITSLDVSIAAGKGDELANEIYEFTGKMLGEACADFAAFSSPEAFIFFGGMTKAGELIMKPIREAYDKQVLKIFKGKAQFLVSGLDGASAAVLGASAVGWDIQ
jgi:anaerobic selenocysteine-containing dehydrogenase